MKNKKDKKSICVVKNCMQPVAVLKHQLCNTHKLQLYRRGYVDAVLVKKYRKHDTVKFV